MIASKKLIFSLIALSSMVGCSSDDNGSSLQGQPTSGAGGGTSMTTGGVGFGGSGSGTGMAGASVILGGQGGQGQGGSDASCGRKNFTSEPKPAHVLLVLDRSGSMRENVEGGKAANQADWKWTLVVPALKEVLSKTDATVRWGLKVFPEGGEDACDPSTVTPNIDIAVAPMNATAVNTAIDATTPQGNGTPTGDAIRAALPHLQAIADDGPKYFLLATDGEPSCAGTTGEAAQQATARPYAVTAITEAATAGYHTFVVGVATTETNPRQALNDMAVAGLEPNPAAMPGEDQFYLATTQAQLVEALTAITGQVASCVFPLGEVPPVVDNIGVRVGTELAPKDTTHANGWDYTDDTYMSVEVYGEWCERAKAAAGREVEIIFACRGDVIR